MLRGNIQIPLAQKKPLLWLNDNWQPLKKSCSASFDLRHVFDAERRLRQFAGLLEELFPELQASDGIIESPLYPADELSCALNSGREGSGRWFVKGDHALPIAGSIKARGGIYEVLVHAEELALCTGLIAPKDDRTGLACSDARDLFARHQVVVGSTGNLGLSIGVMAAALGFRATVHMSADAKEWKKARLRSRQVEVIEHSGDFGVAVAAGREQARQRPTAYFVDDEKSIRLFLGYSVAALRLKQQLLDSNVEVDAQHPLFVYIPCGVGGAPGGITFGLRHLFGDHVHCFFAEPTASPSMLARLASAGEGPISVADVGLDNRTEADGLAVGRASELAARMIKFLISGIFTVADPDLFEDLYLLERSTGMCIEPSAAAALRGPDWLLASEPGRQYLATHGLLNSITEATHVLWTTGGALVPNEEYRDFHERGRKLHLRNSD